MMPEQESMTAKLCSFARAYHSIFDHSKIFDDYLAFDLMGYDEYQNVCRLIRQGVCTGCVSKNVTLCEVGQAYRFLAPIPLSRQAFADRMFEKFVREYPTCQFVICGAGMDSFSFRNERDSVTVFEVDHPATQRYKKQRIEALEWKIRNNTHLVSVDFSCDNMAQKLIEAGYQPCVPTFFTILGVSYYLTLRNFEKTIKAMDAISALGSMILLDYPDKSTFRAVRDDRIRFLTDMTARLGEKMTRGFSYHEMKSIFENHHHTIDTYLKPNEIQKAFFEDRKDGMRAYENIHFICAKKSERYFEDIL